MAKNPIQHVEWRTRDRERLKNFYGSVFGWKFKEEMGGGYTMVDFGLEDMAGGIFAIPPDQQMPTSVCNYVTVEDLGPYEEKIRASGGNVMISAQEIPGYGWFTIFGDPDGNVLAMWKSARPPPPKKKPVAKKKPAKKKAKAGKKKKR